MPQRPDLKSKVCPLPWLSIQPLFGRGNRPGLAPIAFEVHSPRHSPFGSISCSEVNELYVERAGKIRDLALFEHWPNPLAAFVKRRSSVQIGSAAFQKHCKNQGIRLKSGSPFSFQATLSPVFPPPEGSVACGPDFLTCRRTSASVSLAVMLT